MYKKGKFCAKMMVFECYNKENHTKFQYHSKRGNDMSGRPATHSGSWYDINPQELDKQLQKNLDNAKKTVDGIEGARLIISPHAGYKYCGDTMAYSYAALDLNPRVKRIFVLGPSHHVYFRNQIFVSPFESIETPLGDLKVDTEFCEKLVREKNNTGKLFTYMDADTDLGEHSLEMQFPMIAKALAWRGLSLDEVKVVPLLVSNNTEETDDKLARVLVQNLMDPSNIFIISSDFCHWGRRFQFTGYVGSEEELEESLNEETEIEMLTLRSKLPHHRVAIWESVKILDQFAMSTLNKSNNPEKYANWVKYLDTTGNTICGAKPILLVLKMFALESFSSRPKVIFQWPHYSQSSRVESVSDSSVSYSSGYATI